MAGNRASLLFVLTLLCLATVCRGQTAAAEAPTDPLAATREKLAALFKEATRARAYAQVSVSPDGKYFAWVDEGGSLKLHGRMGDGNPGKEIAFEGIEGCKTTSAGSFTWSPDSSAIAYFATCGGKGTEEGQQNLYLAKIGNQHARQLATLKGYVESPVFSPDGKQVAFLYTAGATRPAGALAAMKPWSGVIGEDGVEIMRVAAVEVDAVKPTAPGFLTPEKLHVYEFDWRPDGKGIAFIAAEPPGENNWWVAKLYTEELSGGKAQAPRAILAPAEVSGALHGLQIAVPRWSPDGSAIAFIGGLMSDQGVTGGDLWIVSAQGGEPHDLTAGRPASAVWLDWADNEHIFMTEIASGNEELVKAHLRGALGVEGVNFGAPVFRIPASVGDGRMEMSLSSTGDHSLFVFEASSFEHAPELYGVRPGMIMGGTGGFAGLMQLTNKNDGLKPMGGKVHSMHWKNEGFNIQGWLTEPVGFDAQKDAGKKYPMIVIVHGGPSSAVTARWGFGSLGASIYSKLGYFVFEPNPRGSYGEGEAFTQANRKDFGYGDLRDILAGVDAVEAKYPVDEKRLGLTGWSYGGFMTMFAVTQTHRFRAAVAGAGLSNWQSYYGENSIDQWMIPFFGASVYDDPAVYAKSSAINFIKNATTPTLVVVGDRDGECPAPQSFEFWHALMDLHVKTELVVYPNEGHMFSKPEHWMDVLARAVDWFDTQMAP